MADQIEKREGVILPDLVTVVTEVEHLTSSISQESMGRDRWGLPAVVAFVATILVVPALVISLSKSDRGHLFARTFSEIPRTKVTISGVMPSQRLGILNYRSPADCDEYPTKSGKQGCWGQQERFSKS